MDPLGKVTRKERREARLSFLARALRRSVDDTGKMIFVNQSLDEELRDGRWRKHHGPNGAFNPTTWKNDYLTEKYGAEKAKEFAPDYFAKAQAEKFKEFFKRQDARFANAHNFAGLHRRWQQLVQTLKQRRGSEGDLLRKQLNKMTIPEMLATLDVPAAGHVKYDDYNLSEAARQRRRINEHEWLVGEDVRTTARVRARSEEKFPDFADQAKYESAMSEARSRSEAAGSPRSPNALRDTSDPERTSSPLIKTLQLGSFDPKKQFGSQFPDAEQEIAQYSDKDYAIDPSWIERQREEAIILNQNMLPSRIEQNGEVTSITGVPAFKL